MKPFGQSASKKFIYSACFLLALMACSSATHSTAKAKENTNKDIFYCYKDAIHTALNRLGYKGSIDEWLHKNDSIKFLMDYGMKEIKIDFTNIADVYLTVLQDSCQSMAERNDCNNPCNKIKLSIVVYGQGSLNK